MRTLSLGKSFSKISVEKSASMCSIPPCLPVTVPLAPFASPDVMVAWLPTHERTLNAVLAACPWRGSLSLFSRLAPGSTWSASHPHAGSPTLRLYVMPPVPGRIWGLPVAEIL